MHVAGRFPRVLDVQRCIVAVWARYKDCYIDISDLNVLAAEGYSSLNKMRSGQRWYSDRSERVEIRLLILE